MSDNQYYNYWSQYSSDIKWWQGGGGPDPFGPGVIPDYMTWMKYYHSDLFAPGGPFYYDPTPTTPTQSGGANSQASGNNNAPMESTVSPANGRIPVLYGRRKIPGLFVYMNVIGSDLHVLYIFCEGEIEGFETILVNGKAITEFDNTHLKYERYMGTDTQSVCGLEQHDSDWKDPLRNIAYIWLRIIPGEGSEITDLPKVEAIVKGKKVYDPRAAVESSGFFTGASAAPVYSANPALCLADALTNTRYGGNVAATKVNWGTSSAHGEGTVWDVADECDKPLTGQMIQKALVGQRYAYNVTTDNFNAYDTLRTIYVLTDSPILNYSKITIDGIPVFPAPTTYSFPWQPYVDSYEVYNGTSAPPTQWVGWNNELIGKACLYLVKREVHVGEYFGDPDARWRFNVKVVVTEDANKFSFSFYFSAQQTLRDAIETIRRHYLGVVLFSRGTYNFYIAKERDTVASFTEKDVFNISFPEIQSQSIINRITWTWTDPDTWEVVNEEIEDPTLTDNDEIHEAHYDLSGSLSMSQSKRVAIFLLNSRLSDLIAQFNVYNSFGVELMDTFSLTHSIGLNNKLFYVSAIQQNADGSYTITGREYEPELFSATIETEPTYPDTNLPLPTDIPLPPTNLRLKEEVYKLSDGTYLSKIVATWSASESTNVKSYDIWIQEGSGPEVLHNTTDTRFELRAVKQLITYTFKIAAVTNWDIQSKKALFSACALARIVTNTINNLLDIAANLLQFTIDSSTNIVTLTWTAKADPAILYYEIRKGTRSSTWDTAVKIGTSTIGTFSFTLDERKPKVYVCAKYNSITSPYSATVLSVDLQTLDTPALTVSIVEPNIVVSWRDVQDADKYKLIIDSGGIAKMVWTNANSYTVPIPKYTLTVRVQAWDNAGHFSQSADEDISVTGIYNWNELLNVPISSFTNGVYVNMCFTGSSEVKKPSVAGTAVSLPISNINDCDLFNFARAFNAVAGTDISTVPASYFRDEWWNEQDGYFESAVTDLGALYSGRLICSLNKTISHLGNDITQWSWLLAEYIQDTTGDALADTKVHLEADIYISADSLTWRAVKNDDWVTSVRYVKIAASVLQASPLSECKVTSGAITIDVPDITESKFETGLTGTSKAVTFTKNFNVCSIVIANAIGTGLNAWATNVTKTGFTLNYTTGTTSAYWWAKGY